MIAPISYPTSLIYWLHANEPPEFAMSYREINQTDSFKICTHKDLLRDARIFHFDPPLHLLFPNASSRNHGKNAVCHTIPKGIMPESFIRLTNNLYIASPELTFLLAARHLSLPKLVLLGNDLCSIYRLDEYSPTGQSSRKPITTARSISEYLENCRNVKGLDKARIAARYILDRSNSPMESRLAALFRLPQKYGGAGIKDIALNVSIRLASQAAATLKRDSIKCDIACEASRKAFEYDSNLTHLTPQQHELDKNRSTAMAMSGYSVFTITASSVRSPGSINDLMISARSFLGLRTRMENYNKYHQVRNQTINELFFSN